MGWRLTILGFIATVVAAAVLGIAGSSDPKNLAEWDGEGPPPITRCKDVPPVPSDAGPGWGGDESGAQLSLFWVEGSGADEEFFEFLVRVDDPTCDKRPDIRKYLDVNETPPRFENARIVVRPGEARAYVGYTLIDDVGQLRVTQDGITAKLSDGRPVEWNHQTATGGPSDIGADGTVVVEPANDVSPYTDVGDADYFDAADLTIGETVTVTFHFIADRDVFDQTKQPPTPRAVVKVPFRVVASD